jgi:hypothetical protein
MERNYTPEIMDDFSIKDERIDIALKELKIINYFLGGNSTSKAGIKEVIKSIPENNIVRILDAGAGGSDVLLSMMHIINNPVIFCLDINIRTCWITRINYPDVNSICGDVLEYPFKNESFDIVHTSLFLHHFTEEQIRLILIKLINSSRYAVVINDLRRSIFAYCGIKILTMLFSKSNMVKNDGPLSVKRAFIKKDLLKIINDLNIERFVIKRKWAFRWLVILYKNKS